MKRHFDAIVREETDSGCVVFKHTKMMKPDEANRIKMRALYESLLLTEMSLTTRLRLPRPIARFCRAVINNTHGENRMQVRMEDLCAVLAR